LTNKYGPAAIQEKSSLSMRWLRARLLTLPRGAKQSLMILADVTAYAVAVAAVLWGVAGPISTSSPGWVVYLLAGLIAVPVFWLFGLYASIIRYVGIELFRTGLLATLVVTVVWVAVCFTGGLISDPYRMGLNLWALSLILIVGGRFVARFALLRTNVHREEVIIYGAGDAGALLIANLLADDDYLPVALVDDDPSLHDKRIQGLRIYSPDRLQDLVTQRNVKSVLLAIPSASRRERRAVLEKIAEIPIRVESIPGIRDLVSGNAGVDELRSVGVKDLLGREEVAPNTGLMGRSISGKTVMVTGAGGSIGAELCRQILMQRPSMLVLFEIAEPALYEIDRTLREYAGKKDIGSEIVALLGSVTDQHRLHDVMTSFGVETVFHAAAYKHVPIVEHNLLEGVRNNVLGTWYTVQAASEAKVGSFVLISTDKAVNPTSIMGATKRLAELVLQASQEQHADTCFSMVRFGNVLESSGSVVPLFKEQIQNGGPVTVTHRDIIRYFMTIPEAAQLVIQAGAMADGGDVFVLDMGDPVKIDDLAHLMISLMGLTVRDRNRPDGDIEIVYTGSRPAEKLYEELLIGSNVTGTEHPRILRAAEHALEYDTIVEIVDALQAAINAGDCAAARELLIQSVKEYTPAEAISDLVWSGRPKTTEEARVGTVIRFPKELG
jgi:FlaA1/EpsC-like NDP-sugar epimerase